MQSPGELSNDNIATHSRSPVKRKLNDNQTNAASSKETRPPLSSPINASLNSSKRLKISHSSGPLGRPADMSKTMGIGSRPKLIDLTRPPSNFQPHAGAKRLVIKNLRPSSTKSVNEYYDRTWSELDAALTSIFNKQPPSTPLEVLCRGVEATCRRGQAERLFMHLKDRCKGYLEKQLLPELEKQCGTSNVDGLRTVQRFWVAWNEQSVCLHSPPVKRTLIRAL